MSTITSKCNFLLAVSLLIAELSFSQEISPQLLSGCSANWTQNNGGISFAIGEISVLTYVDAEGNTISSGFSAGTTQNATLIEESAEALVQIQVYPNPLTDLLNVQIIKSTVDFLSISINDAMGKEVYQGRYAGIPNVIGLNTTSFASGTYILTITDSEGGLLVKYNLIKY